MMSVLEIGPFFIPWVDFVHDVSSGIAVVKPRIWGSMVKSVVLLVKATNSN
jgi:hypothetical protein